MSASVASVERIQKEGEVQVGVRTALPSDALKLMAMMRDWQASCAAMFPPVDETDALGWIAELMRTGRIYVGQLEGGRYQSVVTGALALQETPLPWNQRIRILSVAFFYVPPAHRELGVARALCEHAQAAAAAYNQPLVVPLISGAKAGQTAKGYGLPKGAQVGGMYAYGLGE